MSHTANQPNKPYNNQRKSNRLVLFPVADLSHQELKTALKYIIILIIKKEASVENVHGKHLQVSGRCPIV